MATSSLARADVEALVDAIASLAEVRSIEQLRADVVALIPPLVETNLVAWNEIDLTTGAVEIVLDRGDMVPGGSEAFMANIADHPVIAHHQKANDGRPYAISDFLDEDEFHATGIYQHLYRRIGAEDQISFVLPEPSLVVGVAINRATRGFSERDRTMLNRLRLPVAHAYRNAHTFSRLGGVITGLQELAEHAGEGVVLLDRAGHIELLTPRSSDLLARWFDGSSGSALPTELATWLAASRRAPDPPWPYVVERGNRRLIVRRLNVGDGDVLVLSEPSRERTIELLRGLGLTNREAEVMGLVTRGASTAEIARQLGISNHTVYHHVHNGLNKLGAGSRLEAVNLVRQLERNDGRPPVG